MNIKSFIKEKRKNNIKKENNIMIYKLEYKILCDILNDKNNSFENNVKKINEILIPYKNYIIKYEKEYLRNISYNEEDDVYRELLRPLTARQLTCRKNAITRIQENNIEDAYYELRDCIDDGIGYKKKYVSINECLLFSKLTEEFCDKSEYKEIVNYLNDNSEEYDDKISVLPSHTDYNTNEKSEESNINVLEYEIPDGGDLNIYLKWDKNINLDGLDDYFKSNNLNIEINIEKQDDEMFIGFLSKELNVGIGMEKDLYFDEQEKAEYIENIQSQKIRDMLMECDSSYFVDTYRKDYVIAIFYLILYISKQVKNILVYDTWNDIYLTSEDIRLILANDNSVKKY